ncbi:phospholipase D/Transphosphatidylase [Opitutus terrae PB90-1]|uniref:Phospholipase D/Transphosphatidylase n=2 Tax=Opitutus terrae TaxID=107709 RepID=B2A011_OPITP|nr:phospholipase D/Transphosphatidylase [Opitutus terrae PB90-1]
MQRVRKLRRPSRGPRHERPPRSHRNELGWHWTFVALGIAMLLGAYFWYVSARILQEPVRLHYGPEDPAFPAAVGPLLGAEFTGGNSVELLLNGDGFFPPMLAAIRSAKKTITLETYIWAPGRISDEFIAALAERAEAGVKVHVMLDGMGTLKFTDEDKGRLTGAGVEVVKYGRQHWYEIKPNINHRTHRKILVIDGRIGFTGGMCVDDSWLGNADQPDRWRETQVHVEGPAVRQMQAIFAQNWLQTTGRLLLGQDYFPEFERAGQTTAQCFSSGPGEGAESARMSYMLAIASARRSIDIEHAYFVPDEYAVRMLLEARQRGVRIRVIVPAHNDSRFGRAASRSRWDELLRAGVEFYRYEPAMLHAKTMCVDDTFVTVGSVNFDNRSFSINDEVALNVIDPTLGRAHRRMFEHDLQQSTRYTWEEHAARPAYVKLADWFCGLFRSQL